MNVNKIFLAVVCFILSSAYSAGNDCGSLKATNDGVPKEYWVNKCKAKSAELRKDWKAAADYYKKALEQNLQEAPNYELKLDLGTVLCKQNKLDEAKKELEEFICMSGVETGLLSCEGNLNSTCRQMICQDFGSGLSPKAKQRIISERMGAQEILKNCSKLK